VQIKDRGELSARIVNLVLGVWLFISAFVWQHDAAQMTNTWILGVLAVIFSLVAMRVQPVRYLNTLLSIWLFISAFALPHLHRGTVWNNALVALVMFFVSLQSFDTGTRTASDEHAHAT
jgi:phosphoglycerol transferase MdoB-like AlkP superfamily enzyme